MAENGRLPASDLAKTVLDVQVRKDLAKQTNQLAYAFYRNYERAMRATDGYRTYEAQVRLREEKGPALTAFPGTSNHGWGTAIDFASNIGTFTSSEHKWMKANAPRFGWEHPFWARDGGGREEGWHWEGHRVSVDAPYVGIPATGQIGYGSQGAEVKRVQELLRKAGYKNLVVDSDFGMDTGHRVVLFQEDHKLVQDGIVGPKTLAALKGGTAAVPLPAPEPEDTSPNRPADIAEDGVWGYDTSRRLQRVLGLAVRDGVISNQKRYYGFRDIYGKTGWEFNDTNRGSRTIEALQLVIGVGLNDGLFGPQTMTQLARRYRSSGYKGTIKALQEHLNEGKI